MPSPLFSVLIANYNNGCYIKEAIDSVLSQTYTNWEIVIVDDCSTDNSVELYNELIVNPKIRVFYNDRNQGAGYTKRCCVEMARGEICGFVDPDDLLAEKDALEAMVLAHQANPNASLIYSGYYSADENLVIKEEISGADLEGISALEYGMGPISHFVSFKKKHYDLTTGIDPFMKRCVDYDMYYKLEEVGDLIHLNRILYTYRHNSHSISLNDGVYKSRAWHTYTCVEAMKRRGLTDERLMLFPIENVLRKEYTKGYKQGYTQGQEHVKLTKTYRIGESLKKPRLWLNKLMGK